MARGPDPWFNQCGQAKVWVFKSFLCNESSLVFKIKNYSSAMSQILNYK